MLSVVSKLSEKSQTHVVLIRLKQKKRKKATIVTMTSAKKRRK